MAGRWGHTGQHGATRGRKPDESGRPWMLLVLLPTAARSVAQGQRRQEVQVPRYAARADRWQQSSRERVLNLPRLLRQTAGAGAACRGAAGPVGRPSAVPPLLPRVPGAGMLASLAPLFSLPDSVADEGLFPPAGTLRSCTDGASGCDDGDDGDHHDHDHGCGSSSCNNLTHDGDSSVRRQQHCTRKAQRFGDTKKKRNDTPRGTSPDSCNAYYSHVLIAWAQPCNTSTS